MNRLVAVLLVQMNSVLYEWGGNQNGEGYEYCLFVPARAVPAIIRGAGALSVDRALSNKSAA